MKISFNWLNDYINLSSYTVKEIAHLLTMKTCEVDKVEPFLHVLDDIAIGLIKDIQKHPNADKLQICSVETNHDKKLYQVVTGAKNVQKNMYYPFATENTTLPNKLTIKKVQLRGIDSVGMLCSSEEIGMDEFMFHHPAGSKIDGILPLEDVSSKHIYMNHYFNIMDTILDIDNKSITHRPDLWSHFGFARELSALLNQPLIYNPLEFNHNFKINPNIEKLPIEIQNNSAIAYSGVVIDNVQIIQSPIWIQARLISVGMKPINNIVDVSNYVMLDIGQPNHAFDRNYISKKIIVSPSKKNEKITTLKDETYQLDEGHTLIRDADKSIAIAGIIGGKNTQVLNSTKKIFLESASFYRHNIRKTISKINIRTESSQRFEKGLDPTLSQKAINHFISLLKQTCSNLDIGDCTSIFKEEILFNTISLSKKYIQKRLGDIDLKNNQIIDILSSLGMDVTEEQDVFTVKIPSYRSYYDLTIQEDLIEEIGRVIGYKEIKPQPLKMAITPPRIPNYMKKLEYLLKDLFSKEYQFIEVYNYPFYSQEEVQLDQRFTSQCVELSNPIQQESSFLRNSPLLGVLKNVKNNQNKSYHTAFYELERIFLPNTNTLPNENYFLAGCIFIQSSDLERGMNYLQSILNHLLLALGASHKDIKWSQTQSDILHPGRAGQVLYKDKPLILWGEIHPKLVHYFHIKKSIIYFEAFLKDLNVLPFKKTYHQLIKFPASSFEITVLANKKEPFKNILQIVEKFANDTRTASAKDLVTKIQYLDTYRGPSIDQDKKAISLEVIWQNKQATISKKELKELQDMLVNDLQVAGFPLRDE